MLYSGSSPPAGLEAEAGAIHPSGMVTNAARAGAAGAVIITNQPEGIVVRTLGNRSPIPAVGISQEDGRRLVAAMRERSLRLRLTVERLFEIRSSENVVAIREGAVRPSETVVVGAHYDSVPGSPGANDNASGVAVVLEVARALATTPMPRTVQHVLFGAEEFGLFGSFAYASERRRGVVAMVYLDMVGWGDRHTGHAVPLRRQRPFLVRAFRDSCRVPAWGGGSVLPPAD